MRLNIFDIPEDGMNVEAHYQKDAWFRKMIQEAFGDDLDSQSQSDMDLFIVRTGDNVQISGNSHISLNPSCDRCLESFTKKNDLSIQLNMAPRRDMHFDDGDEKELEADDMNFSFYEGEELDLSEVLRELFLLEVPIQYLCKEDCKGLCPRCGKNLNMETCQCDTKVVDPRFAPLQKLLKK